jgi:LPXTG-motif cell wall-anchored protein
VQLDLAVEAIGIACQVRTSDRPTDRSPTMSRASLNRLTAGSLLGLVMAGATLVTAPAAVAAPSTPVVSATTVAPGGSFTVSGVGCDLSTNPNNPDGALAFLDITHLGLGESPEIQVGDYVDPAADGTWTASLTVPANHPLGTYDLVSICSTYYGDPEFRYPTIKITVGAAAVAVAPAPPATCGASCQVVAPGTTLTPGAAVPTGVLRNLALYGYLPFEEVTLVLHSTPRTIGTFKADANGIVVVAFRVPGGTEAGDHNLKVTRADGSVVTYPIKIAAAKQLASTGADVTVPLVLGTGLVLAGGGALFLSRRRREAAQV